MFALLRGALLLAVVALLLSALPSPARARSSPAQVQGITDAIVDNLWAHNDELWHDGDYPRIIALDRIIVGADPHFVDCYNTGAWLMWSDGQDADADAFYRLCIQNNPTQSAAYYDYSSFLMHHKKDYPRARAVLEKEAALPDANVLDWRMLAHAREKAGDLPGSLAQWRRIRARWPHGAPGDPTGGAVDANNLNRVLALQSAPRP